MDTDFAQAAGRVASRAGALLLGILWGFFVAFNVVFSDIFGASEMAWAVVYVVVAYAALGAAFGFAGPLTGARWTPWLAAPGVLLDLTALFDNIARAAYVSAVIAGVIGAAWGGCVIGARARSRLHSRRKSADRVTE